jgi:hypothetical protein
MNNILHINKTYPEPRTLDMEQFLAQLRFDQRRKQTELPTDVIRECSG